MVGVRCRGLPTASPRARRSFPHPSLKYCKTILLSILYRVTSRYIYNIEKSKEKRVCKFVDVHRKAQSISDDRSKLELRQLRSPPEPAPRRLEILVLVAGHAGHPKQMAQVGYETL